MWTQYVFVLCLDGLTQSVPIVSQNTIVTNPIVSPPYRVGGHNMSDCVLPQSDPIVAPHLPYTIRPIVSDINLPYYSASTILRYTIQYDILIVFIIIFTLVVD